MKNGVFATSPRIQKVDDTGNELASGAEKAKIKMNGRKNKKDDRQSYGTFDASA